MYNVGQVLDQERVEDKREDERQEQGSLGDASGRGREMEG